MKKIFYLLTFVTLISCTQAFSQTSTVVMKALNGNTKLNGGSIVKGHLNEIDVLSNSSGQTNCRDCGKPNISSFNFMISLSPATIAFKKILLNGTILQSVDVVYIKGGTTPIVYYKIHMDSVVVENVQISLK